MSHAVVIDPFAELTADYLSRLPSKVEALCAMVERIIDCPGDPAFLHEGRSAAHRLAGTAGSYGCAGVGAAAGVLEELTRAAEAGNWPRRASWASAAATLRNALDDVEAVVVDAQSSTRTRRLALHRVLLVDDDAEFLAAVEAAGRTRGIAVAGALHAGAALELAAAHAYEAAILDVRLGPGGGNGFDLAGHLRALPGRNELPVAFVSAYGEVADRIAATHAGGALFLSKPLDAHGLSTAVHLLTTSGRAARPRLLIVDDDPEFVHFAAQVLRGDMDITAVGDGEWVLEALEEAHPDAVMISEAMSGFSGHDLCRTIRSIPHWQHLPILFIAGARHGAAGRLAAFHAGADDYLTRPLHAEELLARVSVRVQRSRMLRDRLENDALTGLPMRRRFLELMAARMGEVRRRKRCLSLALIDVDHFKQVNDRHGHLAGDRVLAGLGRLLQRRFRAEDLRARWGGEEFALAFSETTPAKAAEVLQRLLVEFSALSFDDAGGRPFGCTFSAGVAGWPADGNQLDALLATADVRLYAAKAAGRNRVVCQG